MNVFLRPVQEKIQIFQQLPANLQKPIVGGRLSKGYQAFLLACMPKSGSTWLCNILAELPDFRITHMVPHYGAREQEVCGDTIDKNLQNICSFHVISQHHVKYNVNTRHCCIQYCIKPVVLLRGIADNLVSLVDHWRNEEASPGYSSYVLYRARLL